MRLVEIAEAGVIDDAPTFAEIGMKVLDFLLSVAGVIAVISLIISGLLFLFSSGDEKKMQLAKKAVTYSVIGSVVVLSALIIVKLIAGFIK